MRKRIIRKELFSPNVYKVYYEDGGIGFQGVDSGNTDQEIIPDQGRDGGLQAWGESKDAEPASPDELRRIEETLGNMRSLSREERAEAFGGTKALDPQSVVRETDISIMNLPTKRGH